MVTESPIVSPRIFAGLKRAKHHFKRVLSCIDQAEMPRLVGCIPLRWPMDFNTVDEPRWSRSNRKFLTMINMNKLTRLREGELYTERMRAVEFFGRTNEIDLYGVGWDKATMRLGYRWLPWTIRKHQIAFRNWLDKLRPDPLLVAARKVYRGELPEKWETLSHYDFALCFENLRIQGWLTEKLFECLRVGTIPIYWGRQTSTSLFRQTASSICDSFPITPSWAGS
jgi:alpha(1,3/1,4) fucosyltransferase